MMPIALLATINSPNKPLITDPVDSTMMNSTPRMALIRVKTLARTISETLRAARVGTSFVFPSATRRATSASDRPAATTAVIGTCCYSRKRSSVERSLARLVVVLEGQLGAVERRLADRSRWRVLADPLVGEDIAVPML